MASESGAEILSPGSTIAARRENAFMPELRTARSRNSTSNERLESVQDEAGLMTSVLLRPLLSDASNGSLQSRAPRSPQRSVQPQNEHEKSPSASVNEAQLSNPPTMVIIPSPVGRATPSTKAPARASSSASIKAEDASAPTRPQTPMWAYYDAASASSDAVQSVWNWAPGHPSGHGPARSRRSLASPFAYPGARLGSFASTSRPFMSVDPYPASIAYSLGRGSTTIAQTWHGLTEKPNLPDYVLAFLLDTIPRQIYSYLMLRLPILYFARVARIFDEGDLSLHEIAALAHNPENYYSQSHMSILSTTEPSSPASPFWNLKVTWEALINSLLQEWKTLNIVSVLLLSAILAMLQLPGVITQPLIFYAALTSQLCSLMSLLYGCMYIIRFGSMRKTYRAIAWAEAAQNTKTVIWWNVWVLLAMPAVWLAWSIILFLLCILTYVWNVNPSDLTDASVVGPASRLVPRTIITALLGLAFIYFILIAITFNQYGEKVDKKWSQSMTDVRMPNDLGVLSSYGEDLPAPGSVLPVPPTLVPSTSSSLSSSPSRRGRRRNRRHRSRTPDSQARPRSRTPDRSRVVNVKELYLHRRGHTPDSRNNSKSRTPDRRERGWRHVPYRSRLHYTRDSRERRVGGGSQDESSASRQSLFQTDTAPTLAPESPVIPPVRHGIPIVPLDGSTYKVVGLWFRNHDKYPMPAISQQRGLPEDQWELFVLEICAAWDGEKEKLKNLQPSAQMKPQDFVSAVLATWNQRLERRHRLQAVLCREYLDIAPESPAWAVYLLDFSSDESGTVPGLAERFGTVPEGLGKVVILDPWAAPSSIPVPAKTTTIARHELETHVRFRRGDSESNSGSG